MPTAVQLPMPRAVFYDASGNPLAAGFVYTYVPGGTTPATTWQDVNEVTPNANPIPLDANGSCLLYGNGNYQLTVTDKLNNQVPAYSGLTYSLIATNPTFGTATVTGNLTVGANTTTTSLTAGSISCSGPITTSTLSVATTLNSSGTTNLNNLNVNATTVNTTLDVMGALSTPGGIISTGLVNMTGGLEVSGGTGAGTVTGYALISTGPAPFSATLNPAVNASGYPMLANAYIAASDGRIKTKQRLMGDEEADRFVDHVLGRWYVKNMGGEQWEGGFIAQEVLNSGFFEMIVQKKNLEISNTANGWDGPAGYQLYLKDGALPLVATSLRAARRRIADLEALVAKMNERLNAIESRIGMAP